MRLQLRESLMRCSNLRELTLQACFFDLAAFSRLLNGVVPRLRKLTMPNLVEPWTRPTQASVAESPGECVPNDRADQFGQHVPGHASFVVPAFQQAHPC